MLCHQPGKSEMNVCNRWWTHFWNPERKCSVQPGQIRFLFCAQRELLPPQFHYEAENSTLNHESQEGVRAAVWGRRLKESHYLKINLCNRAQIHRSATTVTWMIMITLLPCTALLDADVHVNIWDVHHGKVSPIALGAVTSVSELLMNETGHSSVPMKLPNQCNRKPPQKRVIY